MERKDSNSQIQNLITLTGDIVEVLQKIKVQIDLDQKENAENGQWEFAYVKIYLAEMISLLNLSVYLLKSDVFKKYTYFPSRQIMEIVLQLEHVYSVKNTKGIKKVQHMFFKDIAIFAKSSLCKPGDGGKSKIRGHLGFLDIASKILKLDFDTKDVSEKSNRDIKMLCSKSSIIVKQYARSELYSFYEILSESTHANIANIGISNRLGDEIGASDIFEIGIELAIRFCEMIINESKYIQLNADIQNIKRITGIV